ncbi:MAG TPA: hypothetical protein VJP45_08595 [Candidatus Limnocylindria bacterium]|nr:hypothetical protein [Candidatus Limnocylindria bacterium]
MKRAVLSLVVVVGLMVGSALPITAAVEVPVRIDCNDGDSLELTVDLDTLNSLTSSVAAINASGTDLSCALVQLSAPVTVVTFGSVAAAAKQSTSYVIGGGTVQAGCPLDGSQVFDASFAIKMYVRDGGVTGSASAKVADGQCVAGPSSLSSRVTCLAIFPTTTGGGRAWANTFVTKASGGHFAPYVGTTLGWAFEDNGPNGGGLTKDRLWVNEADSSCVADLNVDWHELVSGDLTVRP